MLELNNTVLAFASDAVKVRLQQLVQWDFDPTTRRACRRFSWSRDYAEAIEAEYRKFIALIVLSPGRQFGMAGPVDDYWHEHIIDTQDYIEMCVSLTGRYVHHRPDGSVVSDGERDDGSLYLQVTLPALKASFESISDLWPNEENLLRSKCSSCKDVQEFDSWRSIFV